MTQLVLAGVSVLLVGAAVHSKPPRQAVSPVKLEAGKAILQKGERFILPKGTAIRVEHVKGEAELEVNYLRLIPVKKDQWAYEIRPVDRPNLRIQPERDALKGVEVIFAGKRGELIRGTLFDRGFLWKSQPFEIRDRTGKVLFSTRIKGRK